MGPDSPNPVAVVRRFLGAALAVALAATLFILIRTGEIEWRLVTFASLLFIFSDLFRTVAEGVTELWTRLFHGSVITLDDEIADLERRVADPDLPAERKILAGIRLAEIYRKYRRDTPRAEALLAELERKYPDSWELEVARRRSA